MSDNKIWEYRVESFGRSLSAAKDEEIEETLNEWGKDGWQLICTHPIDDNKIRLIVHRFIARYSHFHSASEAGRSRDGMFHVKHSHKVQ